MNIEKQIQLAKKLIFTSDLNNRVWTDFFEQGEAKTNKFIIELLKEIIKDKSLVGYVIKNKEYMPYIILDFCYGLEYLKERASK